MLCYIYINKFCLWVSFVWILNNIHCTSADSTRGSARTGFKKFQFDTSFLSAFWSKLKTHVIGRYGAIEFFYLVLNKLVFELWNVDARQDSPQYRTLTQPRKLLKFDRKYKKKLLKINRKHQKILKFKSTTGGF